MRLLLAQFQFDWVDGLALAWFAAFWIGYFVYAKWQGRRGASLFSRMSHWRHVWMAYMAERENRMVDLSALTTLATSAQFFASTTILILGALIALMGYTEKAVDVVAELPFTRSATTRLWELKTLLLLLIFVYAFLKFSWSIRQFGFAGVLVGATPDHRRAGPARDRHAVRAADVLDHAAENYNNGLRAYYFGLAALAWFLHPVLFMAAVVVVTGILYHREFRSRTMRALADD